MVLTIAAAFVIVAAAVLTLNARGVFSLKRIFSLKPTEKRITRNLNLADPWWVEQFVEISLPPFKKDFSIYSAFSYSSAQNGLVQVYATRAALSDIRSHYEGLLENPRLSENNSVGVLELDGFVMGRTVKVQNYFSEVSNVIQVSMDLSGEYAGIIQRKVTDSFPQEALEAVPELAAFAAGVSTEGYVMYNYNTFDDHSYANVPLFSRAYTFGGTMEELRNKIEGLGERFTDTAAASISNGIAEIKQGAYLYSVSSLESNSGPKAVLVIQEIPQS